MGDRMSNLYRTMDNGGQRLLVILVTERFFPSVFLVNIQLGVGHLWYKAGYWWAPAVPGKGVNEIYIDMRKLDNERLNSIYVDLIAEQELLNG
jgi:hypothetical protein